MKGDAALRTAKVREERWEGLEHPHAYIEELPDRPYHVQGVDGRSDDLGQHRREGQEVFLAKEDNLPVPG